MSGPITVWGPGCQVNPIVFPGLYTFLALEWGAPGWAVIGALAVVAAIVAHPAARAAERYLERVGASYAVSDASPRPPESQECGMLGPWIPRSGC